MKTLYKGINRPYLPKGANVFYVDINNEFMVKAREMARLSNDQQQPVGAVVVYNGEVLDGDYNEGLLTNPSLIKLHQKFCLRHFLGVPTGKHYWICPGCVDSTSHAEHKIFTRLLKKGIPGRPIDVYTWGHWACCSACCNIMEKIPINNFYLLKNSEILFNPKHPNNIIGRQFKLE